MTRLTRRTLLSSVPALPLLHAQTPTLPDTPAGQVMKKWLAAMSAGTKDAIAAYAKVHEPQGDADHVKMLEGIANESGGFDLLGVEQSTQTEIKVMLRNRKQDRKLYFRMEVEGTNPLVVAGANLEPVESGPPKPKPERTSLEGALKATEEFAAAEAAADRFSGSLLIAVEGQVKLEKAWGMADREARTPNTAATRFRIGSMNKMITATATLQLAQKGKLALTDPLAKHLPDYPNKELAEKVTVAHLLNHTGGTGDIFGPEFEKNRLELREIGDYVKLYGARPLRFQPGDRWAYSNYGFMLLGAVVQQASGQSYYDYVRQNIYLPAGMKSTDSLPENEAVPGRSKGYMRKGEQWVDNKDTLPYRGSPAGGGYSTAGDLFRFARGLQSGKLLDKSLLSEAWRKQGSKGPGYGYGFMVEEQPIAWVGHGGGAPGMNGELRVYQTKGIIVSTLSNFDPPAASNIARYFADRMPI